MQNIIDCLTHNNGDIPDKKTSKTAGTANKDIFVFAVRLFVACHGVDRFRYDDVWSTMQRSPLPGVHTTEGI